MNTRPKVSRCVCPVEIGYQPCEQIVPRHNGWAEIVSVRPERADDQEHGHSRKQEGAYPEVVILISEEKVDDDHCHIGKP